MILKDLMHEKVLEFYNKGEVDQVSENEPYIIELVDEGGNLVNMICLKEFYFGDTKIYVTIPFVDYED